MGRQYNGPYYTEVGDENKEMRTKVQHEANPGSLVDKLLNNPLAAFPREPMRHRLPSKAEHQQRLNAVGHSGRDSTTMGDARSLMEQRPLLDGGEGELLLPYTDAMDIGTHVKQEISPMGANTSSPPPPEFPPNITTIDPGNLSGLEPPSLDSGGVVMGAYIPKHRIKNKRRQKATLANQAQKSQWTIYQGEFELPVPPPPPKMHRGEICPSGMALLHQGIGYQWVPN